MAEGEERIAQLTNIAPGLALDDPNRDEILECHREAIELGQDGYIDPVSGLFVLTAAHHLDRGSCCESICRHCPYDFKPEGLQVEEDA